MNRLIFLSLFLPSLALGSRSYYDQVCSLGNDERLISRSEVVFYYQVEAEAKLEQILVMIFQMDVIKDNKSINQIKLFNGFENRSFRRGEIVLLPQRFVKSEYNKRLLVLANCEVVPFIAHQEDDLY